MSDFGQRCNRLAVLLAAGLTLFCAATPAAAHPDIAVTLRVLFDIHKGNLTSLGETWTFDAHYSRALRDRFDRDRNGQFSAQETTALAARLRRDLTATRFFTTLKAGRQQLELGDVSAFHASIDGDAVTVVFALPLGRPFDLTGQSADLLVRDERFTAAFQLADRSALQIRGDEGHCVVTAIPAPEDRYFADLVVPQKMRLACRP